MKNTFLYILVPLALVSCKHKEPIAVQQIASNEMVTILPNLKNPQIKDSIPISIPTEFKIMVNSSNLIDLDVFYLLDGKRLLDDFIDYQVYNKKNKRKPIHTLKPYLSSDKPINIIIKERNHLISKKDANELLKKYDINLSLNNLKFGDTIKLTTYNKFRIDNKQLINGFNKISDSIIFVVWSKGGKTIYKKKINW
ncbi:hypothetical protein [Flavobacterium aquidurense]|uniref:hypothetical protein n=1 Tax=Flavobacterium aquidurense TaxID=362413 RepID=UPI002856D6B9|nr:hypothetical protein [Flavobacterium aquidurense]MDR7371008.1 hypothetical protein [Flavobacterium aquidurense]